MSRVSDMITFVIYSASGILGLGFYTNSKIGAKPFFQVRA